MIFSHDLLYEIKIIIICKDALQIAVEKENIEAVKLLLKHKDASHDVAEI